MFSSTLLANPETSKVGIKTSPAMSDLLHTVENSYGKPKGMNLGKMINQYPDSLACFLGLSMQRQMSYGLREPKYKKHYFTLLQEVTDFLKDLSDYHQGKELAKGHPTDRRSLLDMYEKGSSKELNNMFIGDLPLDPYRHNMPNVLVKVEVEKQPPVSDLGKLPVLEEDDPGKINLLGEESPPAESSSDVPPGRLIWPSKPSPPKPD